jgi:cell division protein FtsI (penicillin-binding protein 3)
MDVKTGAIRAIVNLGRNSEGSGYYEKRNYAVWESTEPGSTFKTIALMAALEDKLVDTAQHIDTENGIYEVVPGAKVKDSNYRNRRGGYGVISLGEALEKSSNTAIVKALYPVYAEEPQRFVDRLYALGLDRKLGLEFHGEGSPKIPQPGDKNWSRLSLPWMLFGYEVSFTPLQILAMYNAIANEGIMVKPRFVERLELMGRPVKTFDTEVIHPSICSKETLSQLRYLLTQVVESPKGTANNIQTDGLRMAGKTGTCQLNYWLRDDQHDYQSSFVGYFPADEPRYSCIVVVNKPTAGSYYGSTVAAPVFRKIAMGVERLSPRSPDELKSQPIGQEPESGRHLALETLEEERMPNFRGMRLSDAIEMMENHGMKVRLNGFAGSVRSQWPRAGDPLPAAGTIILEAG